MITDTTLVVGMDIGCEFNAMCLMNNEETVLGRYPKIYNSRKGFDYFVDGLTATKGRTAGINPEKYLQNNDSYNYSEKPMTSW